MQLSISGSSQQVEVSDRAFGHEFNETLVHQAIVAYLAGGRAGSKAQKTRSDVRGGGRKPWRQKGTGRARAGTIRSPLWRGGGVTFAARPRDFDQKLNKKMYQGALRCILSELVRQERLVLVEQFDSDTPKTRDLVAKLEEHPAKALLIVIAEVSDNLRLASQNLAGVQVMPIRQMNPVALVRSDKVIMTVAALKAIEERLI